MSTGWNVRIAGMYEDEMKIRDTLHNLKLIINVILHIRQFTKNYYQMRWELFGVNDALHPNRMAMFTKEELIQDLIITKNKVSKILNNQ